MKTQSSYVCRLRDNSPYEVVVERTLTEDSPSLRDCDQMEIARAIREKALGIRKKLEDQFRARSLQPADQKALSQARAAAEEAERKAEASRPPHAAAFGRGDNLLANVSRYETTLERSLFKALHELERLQARRAGQPVAPPAVVDVNLDVHHDTPNLPAADGNARLEGTGVFSGVASFERYASSPLSPEKAARMTEKPPLPFTTHKTPVRFPSILLAGAAAGRRGRRGVRFVLFFVLFFMV